MTEALEEAASAFRGRLQLLGLEGAAELGDPVAFGRRAADLAAGAIVWRRAIGPLLEAEQVQQLLGGVPRRRLHELVRRHRLLALRTQERALVFPAFQFSADGAPYAELQAMLARLRKVDVDA